ncbi:TetR/AcrR family transcriptional regulator [Streptomyces sp. V4-01]|uniref:TetR/AcrR family transcriptional regulator n=1 Tax=Actinacidiphila polyblastidii TaxID=3110430 RepID=A0ABU7PCE4_9ACTN|nr:TetR/AcrR family transcriptional regulator [Streptomyces sp. V4-01]
MPRPRSEDRRNAIMSAAARVIASQGLGAATAVIAKEAGVSNGSLFVYFDTKTALLNELYVALKAELGAAVVAGLPVAGEAREQVRHLWTQWSQWAAAYPYRRRALAQLQVADDITAESRQRAHSAMTGAADVLEGSRAEGPMRDVPLGFVLVLISAIAEAAIDEMIREPAQAEARSSVAFDAIWRVLAGPAAPAL